MHGLLAAARENVLSDALQRALMHVDPNRLSAEIVAVSPVEPRRVLQAAGIRDEHIFVTPAVLEQRPSLLGYYRLLLGISQKQFYASSTGLARFKVLEQKNVLPPRLIGEIEKLCVSLNHSLAELITGVEGGITPKDVEQLPLLLLGTQFDGSWRNLIGQRATREVFDAMKSVIQLADVDVHESEKGDTLTFLNRSNRKITLALAADPDVVITEDVDGRSILKVAIEIKGGTDLSNAHNRAGEAEKSHQKARNREAADFWTIMATSGMDLSVLKQESPTTRKWFDLVSVLEQEGESWQRLVSELKIAVGV